MVRRLAVTCTDQRVGTRTLSKPASSTRSNRPISKVGSRSPATHRHGADIRKTGGSTDAPSTKSHRRPAARSGTGAQFDAAPPDEHHRSEKSVAVNGRLRRRLVHHPATIDRDRPGTLRIHGPRTDTRT